MTCLIKLIKKIIANYSGVSSNSIEKVVFFELKNKRFYTKDGTEITNKMLKKYPHQINSNASYIKIN